MKIIKGDNVRVNFNNAMFCLCKEAEVLNVPHQIGESWHFRDQKTNELHYVSEGCTVTKLNK